MKTDKDGKVTETRDFYRAPIAVDTWVRCERIVNAWIDYASRQYDGIVDTINKRREKVSKDCAALVAAANALLEFADNIPQKFIDKYSATFADGVKYGYNFPTNISAAFAKDDKKK